MPGELVYFVVPAADADRARAFYGEALGWEFAPGSVPDGFHISNLEATPGGLHGGADGSSPQVYFMIDDLDASAAKIRELGGSADEPTESASGRYARCRDDQGVEFWIFEAPRG